MCPGGPVSLRSVHPIPLEDQPLDRPARYQMASHDLLYITHGDASVKDALWVYHHHRPIEARPQASAGGDGDFGAKRGVLAISQDAPLQGPKQRLAPPGRFAT